MKNNVWKAMLIIGISFIISGFLQIYWHNTVLAVWMVVIGIVEIILSIIQKKKGNKEDK